MVAKKGNKYALGNKGGRPTDYSKDILIKARTYRDNLPEDEQIHTIEGLSDYLGIARSTIYDWTSQEDKKEFSDIIEGILSKQGKYLVNKGLSGEYNPTIAKVLLSKHGYREGIEQMGKDGKDLIPDQETKAKSDKTIDEYLNGSNQRNTKPE